MKKIIILASERSGTNLLRTLLGNHPLVSAPVAPHFINAFRGMSGFYGDLNIPANAILLIEKMKLLANHSYNDWKITASATEMRDRFQVNSLQSAFNALYSQKAREDGKLHFVCKDNQMENHAELLQSLNCNDEIRYIYLVRDPRDHVASWLETPLYMHHPIEIANRWVKEQQKIAQLNRTFGIAMHTIRYEDLIADTEKTMTGVLAFADLPVDAACFGTDVGNKEAGRNLLWKNLNKPIDKNNQKKYLRQLSKEDLRIVETICSKLMDKYHYEKDTTADWTWKRFRGFGLRMKLRRARSIKKNKAFFFKTMAELQDKHRLLSQIEKDVLALKIP